MNPLDSRELAASMVVSSRLLAGGIVRSIVVSFQSGRDPVLEVARETPAGITCGKIGIFSDAWPVLRQAFKAWEQREVRDFRHRSLSINVNGPLLGSGSLTPTASREADRPT